MGPLPKIVAQIQRVFGFEGGYHGPPQTSTPPWANPRYVPGVSTSNNVRISKIYAPNRGVTFPDIYPFPGVPNQG